MKRDKVKEASVEAQIAEDLAHYDAEVSERSRRHLKPGESVDASFLGIPGLRIEGSSLEVFEYPDGTLQPILPDIQRLNRVLFLLILQAKQSTGTPQELRFLRRFMRLTQDQLANRTGLARETISRMENAREPVSVSTWQAVRGIGFASLFEPVNQMPSDIREGARESIEVLQDVISSMVEGVSIALPETPAASSPQNE